jgi:hypothetical protein
VVDSVLIDTDVNKLRDIVDDSFEDPVRLHVGELRTPVKGRAANLSRGAFGLVNLSRMLATGEEDDRGL